MPSPLKSPTTTDQGDDPTPNGLPAAAVKPPAPFPSSTVTLSLAKLTAAISGTPSPLKSPTTTDSGAVPTAAGLPVAVNPPDPFPSSTVTLLLRTLATARS